MKILAISTLIAFTTACAPDVDIDDDGVTAEFPLELEEMIAKTAGDLPETEVDPTTRVERGMTPEMAKLIIKRIALDVIKMGCDVTTTFVGQYSSHDESFGLLGRLDTRRRVYEATGAIFMKDSKNGKMEGDVHLFSTDPKEAVPSGDIRTSIRDGRLSGELNVEGAHTQDVFGVSMYLPRTDRGYLLGVTAHCD